ncbi:MAG: DnaJ C-terminal domain-containing protein [Burkholderiaceae bacterium]
MEFKDYYKTLGVEKTATAEEVKKAYRRLARKFHPDVSKEPDAAARMSELNEANAVISDPEKRTAYDGLGQQQQAGREFRPPPNWDAGYEFTGGGGSTSGGSGQDYSDFFEELFGRQARAARSGGMGGGGAGARRAEAASFRGEDHHAKIELDLLDAYQGAERAITLRGAHLDAQGRVVNDERTLNVSIPKGVREGQQIRLAGQGSAGYGGGANGDLFLEVSFRPDPRFRVQGRDVTQSVLLAPWEAALGAQVEVPMPAGSAIEVTVPGGWKKGKKLRLKGRGIPGRTDSDAGGDMYLELDIALPAADTPKAREIYETMQRELGTSFNPRANA